MAALGSFTVAAANTLAPGDRVILDNSNGQVVKATGNQAGRYVAGVAFTAYAGHTATAGQSVVLFEDPAEVQLYSAARIRNGQGA
jgi:hypothetical protein